jgi:hypothetical protein
METGRHSADALAAPPISRSGNTVTIGSTDFGEPHDASRIEIKEFEPDDEAPERDNFDHIMPPELFRTIAEADKDPENEKES